MVKRTRGDVALIDEIVIALHHLLELHISQTIRRLTDAQFVKQPGGLRAVAPPPVWTGRSG
jgi:hypothetical protein